MNERNKIYKNRFIALRVILIIILFPFVIIWIISNKIKALRRKKQNRDLVEVFNLSQIDELSGVEFEELVKQIFEKQGYEVSLTKKSHDYGADLILKDKKKVYIVQTKCYSHTVGIKAVQEVVSSLRHYRADGAFVVTNSTFSKDAMVLASEHGVRLIDRDVLSKLISKFEPRIDIQKKTYSATLKKSIDEIEARYRFWI